MSGDPFIAHRGLLFTVAYEILGSVADAEDVVQEAWLRWAEVDRGTVPPLKRNSPHLLTEPPQVSTGWRGQGTG